MTALPVPHPKENPGKGEMPGLRSRRPTDGGIVSGRLNHENSERGLKVPGFEGCRDRGADAFRCSPPVRRVELPMLAGDEYRTWELDKWTACAVA